ncbi:hypothetical protein MY1884_009068 [Beauveria asiatica]
MPLPAARQTSLNDLAVPSTHFTPQCAAPAKRDEIILNGNQTLQLYVVLRQRECWRRLRSPVWAVPLPAGRARDGVCRAVGVSDDLEAYEERLRRKKKSPVLRSRQAKDRLRADVLMDEAVEIDVEDGRDEASRDLQTTGKRVIGHIAKEEELPETPDDGVVTQKAKDKGVRIFQTQGEIDSIRLLDGAANDGVNNKMLIALGTLSKRGGAE